MPRCNKKPVRCTNDAADRFFCYSLSVLFADVLFAILNENAFRVVDRFSCKVVFLFVVRIPVGGGVVYTRRFCHHLYDAVRCEA